MMKFIKTYCLLIFLLIAYSAISQNNKNLRSSPSGGMADEDWLGVLTMAAATNSEEAYHIGRALVGASTFSDDPYLESAQGAYLKFEGVANINSFFRNWTDNSVLTETLDGAVMTSINTSSGEAIGFYTTDSRIGSFHAGNWYLNPATGYFIHNRIFNQGRQVLVSDLSSGVSFSTADQAKDFFRYYASTTGLATATFNLSVTGISWVLNHTATGAIGNIQSSPAQSSMAHTIAGNPTVTLTLNTDFHIDTDDTFIINDIDDNNSLTKLMGRNSGTGEIEEMDVSAIVSTAAAQTLSLDASALLSISGGNSVSLSSILPLAANVGAGTGLIFRDITGTPANTINFKTLIAGTNISIVNGADAITINAGGGGGGPDGVLSGLALATATLNATLTLGGPVSVDLSPLLPLATNLGAGEGVWGTVTGSPANTLNFKSLIAGTNITITSTASEITINSTAGGGISNFTDLADTPASYNLAGSYFVMVNAAGTGLEFNGSIDMLWLEDANNIMSLASAWTLGYNEVLEVQNGLNTNPNAIDPWDGEIEWGGDLLKNTSIDHITGDYSASFVGDPRVIIGDGNVWPDNSGDGLIVGENNTVISILNGLIHGITAGENHSITAPPIGENLWNFTYGDAVSMNNYTDAFVYGSGTFLTGTVPNSERAVILGDIGSTIDGLDDGGIITFGSSASDIDWDYTGDPGFYNFGMILSHNLDADLLTGSSIQGDGKFIDILSTTTFLTGSNFGASAGQDGFLAILNSDESTFFSQSSDWGQWSMINVETSLISGNSGQNRVVMLNTWNSSQYETNVTGAATMLGCETCEVNRLNTSSVVILGGFNNSFDGLTILGQFDNSVIVGGNGINPVYAPGNMVYVPNLSIDNGLGTITTPASSLDAVGAPGQFLARQIGGSWFLLYKIDAANWGRVLLDTVW